MNTKNDSQVEQFVKKLADLSIDPSVSSKGPSFDVNAETPTKSIKRKISREYTIADLVPMDDLAFHWLQATTMNNDVPVWLPGNKVMSYLDDFMPKKKVRHSSNADEKLMSSEGYDVTIEGESGLCRVPDFYVCDSHKDSFALLNEHERCKEKHGMQEKF